ncbi:MAG: ABC transporter ATP-binding protein [Micropepsaceae bacterium]
MISAEKEKVAALTVKGAAKGAAKDAAAGDRSPAAARPRIKVEGLTKRFAKTLAVDDIDFDIPAGSFTALLGGNGAGKTTTIAMLLGLVSPTAGNIEILGHDLARTPAAALAQMNFQSPYVDLPRRLTVRQNLNVYGRLYGVLALKDRIAELADALDLEGLLDRPLGELSAGQRTRAGLAKAFINRPQVVLLDEPTASLDPDTADWVRSYLAKYAREASATFLIASHNMLEVERLCDQVLMMRTGRIVDRGSPKALLSKYGRSTLEEVFLDIARAGRAP